ncbi:hypothetical protein BGZ93_000982 [Podila epicladia]|nr:hypothetical protein BGZ92_002440 [Podila epicladia]KAG0098148.1 hypothetical protein BGZ93_000982 [Podila epicladia]
MPPKRAATTPANNTKNPSKKPRWKMSNSCTDMSTRQKVFAIPSLRWAITSSLTKEDVLNMMRTCQEWYNYWAPIMYSSSFKVLNLWGPGRIRTFPNLEFNGRYVTRMTVTPSYRSNLVRLFYYTTQLRELTLKYISHSHICYGDATHLSRFDSSLFVALSGLTMLSVLKWDTEEFEIHADDLLLVIKSCSNLSHLGIENAKIAYPDPKRSPKEKPWHFVGHASRGPEKPYEARCPLSDSNKKRVYAGRRLRHLDLQSCRITNRGLLRILGIDWHPTGVHKSEHALEFLRVHVNMDLRLNHKATSRILAECSRLETLNLERTSAGHIKLFHPEQVWACEKSLQKLVISLAPVDNPSFQGSTESEFYRTLIKYSAEEQQQIKDRLQRLVCLRELDFSGFSLDFRAVIDTRHQALLRNVHYTIFLGTELTAAHKENASTQIEAWIKMQSQKGWVFRWGYSSQTAIIDFKPNST